MFSLQSRQLRGWVTRYALAIGLPLTTLLFCLALSPNWGDRIPFSFFLPAIIITSYFCGTGPSLLAAALSVAAADWLFIEPQHSLRIAHLPGLLDLSLFAGLALIICWYGHANRVAKQKMERSLDETQRLREDYQSLFELSAAGQAEVDASSGRFTRVNSRFCMATGYPAEELMRMNFLDLTLLDDRQEVQVATEKLLHNEIPMIDLEKRCVCRNGEIIDALVSATVIKDSSGRPQKLVAAIRDVTLQKQVERALRYAHQKLETVVAERTSELQQDHARFEGFCSSIAHDLRAPLRAMHNFANLLNQRSGNQLPEQGKTYTKRIASASLRMDRLLIDLLEYGRVSYAEISLITLDTEQLVRNLVERIRQTPLGRSAVIEIQSPLAPIRADARLLEEAIENLIINGLKFSGPAAQACVRIRAEDHGEKARLCVEDNGLGIPKEYHQLIFGVFQRLYENEPISTGIGLAIVRTAIERMHGNVGLDSAPGKGSSFWIELPKL